MQPYLPSIKNQKYTSFMITKKLEAEVLDLLKSWLRNSSSFLKTEFLQNNITAVLENFLGNMQFYKWSSKNFIKTIDDF